MRYRALLKASAIGAAVAMTLAACTNDNSDENTSDDGGSSTSAPGQTSSAGASGQTLKDVVERGTLNCGVNGQLLGFSNVESDGSYTGIDVDYCRAVAAAVLGDADAVEYTDLTAEARFTALQSGDIDVLIRNGTWTASRDGALGLQWTAPTFYDGQGMLVNAGSDFDAVEDMDGTTICVQTGTTTEINLETYFAGLNVTYEPLNVVDEAAVLENFSSGACDGYTTDKSGLSAFAATYDGDVMILDETMSKEPLGPAVREGDEEWFDIVQWVVFATFQAEEFGLTSENISSYTGDNPSVMSFISQDFEPELGFPDDEWVVRVIEAVGNYQEIYDRNIKPLGIPEGPNKLWTEGGLLYSPPFG